LYRFLKMPPASCFAFHGPRDLDIVLPFFTRNKMFNNIPNSFVPSQYLFFDLCSHCPTKMRWISSVYMSHFSSCTKQCMHSGTATAYGGVAMNRLSFFFPDSSYLILLLGPHHYKFLHCRSTMLRSSKHRYQAVRLFTQKL
jgi:hypothetical protein